MNLSKKKHLAVKTLKVGKSRIIFNKEGLTEIKEAITKQDIKDLVGEGIITIKPVKGRKKIKKRKTKRGPGKIKKKVSTRKQTYVKITRKLRNYLGELKKQGKISNELLLELRKKIRMRNFKSKSNLKEYLINTEKIDFKVEGKKKATKSITKPKSKGKSKK